MRLLDRYLLREFLVPLGYCLCGFVILYVFFDLFSQLNHFQSCKLHPGDIVDYYLVSLPSVLAMIAPMALLLALLYALTNHARNHELTAMRAAGISLWRLCAPYFVVGTIASVALFALNEFCVPDSAESAERILARRLPRPPGAPGPDQVRNLGFVNAGEGRKWQIGLYNTTTGEMAGVNVHWSQSDGSTRWLQADRGIRTNEVWTFFNVLEYNERPETNTLLTPIMRTNVLVARQFSETPDEIKSEIKLANSFSIPGKTLRSADFSIAEILNYLRFHPKPAKPDARRLFTKLHERLAEPWTCLVVVLIAIPFGAASGRRNVYVGVASSILICVIYYILQQFSLWGGTMGWPPPWLAAWLPNMLFAFVGLLMTARVR
ncbi:MAG TPA: LptF/LptG family permease [Candidatus Dormibacteraeota bacterium]|nr:LptF/LptG family permease [Candidatus Dormibacteraeota bacterium]